MKTFVLEYFLSDIFPAYQMWMKFYLQANPLCKL